MQQKIGGHVLCPYCITIKEYIMEIKQPLEIIDKYNKVLIEHYPDVLIDNHGMSPDINYRILFTYVYGHNPLYEYGIAEMKDTKALKLYKRSLDSVTLKDKFARYSKNYSFIDTAEKLGCVAFPVNNIAMFLTEDGFAVIETYSANIGDSEIKRIEHVKIYTDNKDTVGQLAEHVMDNLVMVDLNTNDMSSYLWVRQGYSSGLMTQQLEFKRMELDLNKNYNDDMPYEKIVKLLNSDHKELILFNGEAGTGKTSLIKHLIGVIDDKKFLYIDSSLLSNVTSSSFISFLLEYRNSVVVLEDCEKILSKREEGNPFMGTLLNLTDGIIGETVNCKFICSFNCPESKIDEALLRKGRLSLKYTFNPLSLEKTQKFIPDAKKGMTLADIYNKDDENVVNKQEVKKIGF